MSNPKQSKLTDLQLLLLSKASHDDHAIELPPNLKGRAAAKAVKKLIAAHSASRPKRSFSRL